MSAVDILSVAYPCLCLGFCLGFAVSAIFAASARASQDAPE